MARKKLSITVEPAQPGGEPPKRPRTRWPWVAGGAACIIAVVAGAQGWRLAHPTPHPTAAAPAPVEATSGAPGTGAEPFARESLSASPSGGAPAGASAAAPPAAEPLREPPRLGAVRIAADTPAYAVDSLAHADKQVRVGTGRWMKVHGLPLTLQGATPGTTPVWFTAKGFEVERPAGTNLVVALVASGATTDVTFALVPRAARLEVQGRSPAEGEPRRVRARHILVKVKSDDGIAQKAATRTRAEGLRQQLTNGADFATVAREHSDCPSKTAGGDLGFFERGVMVPPFEEAAFRLAPGRISEVVETVFGLHVLQVLEREGGGRLLSSNAFVVACTSPDGRRLSGNPLEVPSLQPLTVTVAAAGYRLKNLSLGPLAPEAVERREVSLERDAGAVRVTVAVPDYAREYLGRTAKRLRLSTNEWLAVAALPHVLADLPCGPLDLAVDAEGFGLVTQRITVVDGQSAEAAFVLAPRPATLTVVCNVTGAVAQVSGLSYSLSGSLPLAPLRPLELTIMATGYAARTVALAAMEPGQAYRQEVNLEPAPAMTPPSVPAIGEAGKPMLVDLGDGVKMEFVWIEALGMWVGKYEVTNEEYRKFRPGHDSGAKLEQSLNGERQPVVRVSFGDARGYADWLTRRETVAKRLPSGYEYRLPTTPEWRAFAQCGDGRKYPWGNDWPPKYGNYADDALKKTGWNLDAAGYDDGFVVSCPVEQSGRNDWGLYGVGGNVDESTVHGTTGARCGARWCYSITLTCSNAYQDILLQSETEPFEASGFRLVLAPVDRPARTLASPVSPLLQPHDQAAGGTGGVARTRMEPGAPLAGTWRLTHGGEYWVTVTFTWDAGVCRAGITEWGKASWAKFTVESVDVQRDDVVLTLKSKHLAGQQSVTLRFNDARDRLDGSVSGAGYTKVIPVAGQLVSR